MVLNHDATLNHVLDQLAVDQLAVDQLAVAPVDGGGGSSFGESDS